MKKSLFRPDIKPSSILLEQTAMQFATIFFEAGRSSGLQSKHKTAIKYAKANWPKFIPKVIDTFLDMLNKPNLAAGMKEEIFTALMERHNDPTLNASMPSLPDIDVKKVLAITGQQTIKVREQPKTIIRNDNTSDTIKAITVKKRNVK